MSQTDQISQTNPTVRECGLQAQQQLLRTLGLDAQEARFEAQLLLFTALKVDRAWLIAHEIDALEANIHAEFQALLSRRLQGEPIAYILGYREFYGLKLTVSQDTLIPRPDTETLVDAALARIPLPSFRPKSESSDLKTLDYNFDRNDGQSVLDLGTGTGAIALAIAKHRPDAHVIALDASTKALAVAQQNAHDLNITNVRFLHSDWFSAIDQRFDVIVSNPPYIEQRDAHLQQGDLRFEPQSALASGTDGLDDIRKIVQDYMVYLKPQGWLLLEHGFNQAQAVADLMAENGLVDIATMEDLGGNDRVTMAKNPLIVSIHWD